MPRMTLTKCPMTYPYLAAALLLAAAASADASHFVECGRIGRCPAGEVGHPASDEAVHEIRCCSDADPTQPPYNFTGRWDVKLPRKATTFATSGFVCPYTESPQWGLATEGVSNCPRGTYDQAAAVCAEVPGARLCTAYEALNNCLRGTGCGFDDDLVWTATSEADVVGGTVPPFDPDIDGDWTTVFANDFDDGTWQDFAPGGELATLNTNRLWTFGLSPGSVRLVDNSGMDSSALLNLAAAAGGAFATSPYAVHRVRFWWHARSFENDEDFYVEYCPDDPAACEAGDASWVQLGRWEHCCTEAETSSACNQQTACDFDNEDMGFHVVALPTGTGSGGGGDPHLRFRSDSSGVGDYLYIDHVEIQGKGTESPTATLSTPPSGSPTASPEASPSVSPSKSPTDFPTTSPEASPSASPTEGPTNFPTASPQASASASPSKSPTDFPTTSPEVSPSANPSKNPSAGPTTSPEASPSASPNKGPTNFPTTSPETSQTASPTKSPPDFPTTSPEVSPSANPSKNPSAGPTTSPEASPSASPNKGPTNLPTASPEASPTSAPVECTVDADCDDSLACNGAEVCTGGSCQTGPPLCDPQGSQPYCIEASSSCVQCTSKDQCADESPCLPQSCHGDGYCYTIDACAEGMACVVTGDSYQCNPITDAPSQSPSIPELKYVFDNDCTTVPGYDIVTGCPGSPPLDLCEGDCDYNAQCAKGLICRERTSGSVAGCTGTPTSDKDYCIFPDPNELVYVYDNGATGNVNTPPLQACQGDCDNDNDCDVGLVCYERTGTTAVYGCTGSGISGKDYCHVPPPPTEPPTKAPTPICLEIGEDCSQSAESDCCSGICVDGLTCGANPFPELTRFSNGGSNYPECQGDCDIDEDCAGSLVCFQSEVIGEIVPGCSGVTDGSTDYCFTPTVHTGHLALFYRGDELPSYSECQGDCDSDSECPAGMRCFQRGSSNANARVPNCDGTGIPGEDYCYQPEETPPPPPSPPPPPPPPPAPTTHVPTATPTACPESPEVTSQPTGPVTYQPGNKTAVSEDTHVALSAGLTARVIAMAGSPVNLAGGGQSPESFHSRPDGAAVFQDGCGGWSYVSNSEAGGSTTYTGGVGALYFNALGEVTGYRMIQKNTRRNCSGGKTWWGTWVTCEECGSTGGVFEVHPKGHSNGDATIKRNTLLGRRNGRSGGNYEGVAYYNPSPTDPNVRPSFYLTEDATSGPLERFRPSNAVLADAIANNDFYKLLHDDPDGTAVTDYLNLVSWESNDNNLTHYGNFDWSPDFSVGRTNANLYFRKCEGIDVRNGLLYMTCKTNKQFFILDLEAQTYVESHTDDRQVDMNGNDLPLADTNTTGPFAGQPDQIRAFLDDTDDSLVYFCEDVGDKAGIHARNSTGEFYTIAQDEGGFHSGETTGLAFSPDHKHMYVAWQSKGYIYDITRADGRSFGGETLTIQYHGKNSSANEFIYRFLRKRKD